MSEYNRNKPKNKSPKAPQLDLKQLRDDVLGGSTDMGKPERGYYLATTDGIMSLRDFCSSILTADRLIVNYATQPREFQVIDGGSYSIRKWDTTTDYLGHLHDKLKQENPKLRISPVDSEIAKGVLDFVYDGELNKDAVLGPCGDERIQNAMKKNIVDAYNDRDIRTVTPELRHAAIYAYENILAPQSTKVYRAEERDDANYTDQHEEEWLKDGARVFTEQALIESGALDEHGHLDLNDTLSMFETIISDAEEYDYEATYARQWVSIQDHLLDKGVMLMLNDGSVGHRQNGMKHQQDVHDALNLSEEQDRQNNYDRHVSSVDLIEPSIGDTYDLDDNYGFE